MGATRHIHLNIRQGNIGQGLQQDRATPRPQTHAFTIRARCREGGAIVERDGLVGQQLDGATIGIAPIVAIGVQIDPSGHVAARVHQDGAPGSGDSSGRDVAAAGAQGDKSTRGGEAARIGNTVGPAGVDNDVALPAGGKACDGGISGAIDDDIAIGQVVRPEVMPAVYHGDIAIPYRSRCKRCVTRRKNRDVAAIGILAAGRRIGASQGDIAAKRIRRDIAAIARRAVGCIEGTVEGDVRAVGQQGYGPAAAGIAAGIDGGGTRLQGVRNGPRVQREGVAAGALRAGQDDGSAIGAIARAADGDSTGPRHRVQGDGASTVGTANGQARYLSINGAWIERDIGTRTEVADTERLRRLHRLQHNGPRRVVNLILTLDADLVGCQREAAADCRNNANALCVRVQRDGAGLGGQIDITAAGGDDASVPRVVSREPNVLRRHDVNRPIRVGAIAGDSCKRSCPIANTDTTGQGVYIQVTSSQHRSVNGIAGNTGIALTDTDIAGCA